jgi:transposase
VTRHTFITDEGAEKRRWPEYSGSLLVRRRAREDAHRDFTSTTRAQDGRRLRQYERRWIVERFFARMQRERRRLVRWEYYSTNSLGFVQLAALCMLLRQF